eukprot:15080954-Alexandrium_andersonii.AAC.1
MQVGEGVDGAEGSEDWLCSGRRGGGVGCGRGCEGGGESVGAKCWILCQTACRVIAADWWHDNAAIRVARTDSCAATSIPSA